MAGKNTTASEEQLIYAKVLEKGMAAGLLGLFVTCGIYMSGMLDSTVPVQDIQKYWSMPVDDYMHATGIKRGWDWAGHLGRGDFLNFIPIAILAGITILSYIAIVPVLLRKNDKIYAVIAILEVIVLVVAASGILGSGGGH
jgi:hypothetical protein